MRMYQLVGTIALYLAALLVSTPAAMARPNEPSKSIDLAKGEKVYVRHCAGCHGQSGKGDGYQLLGPDPANLTRPATKKKTDAALLTTIHEGKPNMPSWKALLSEDESRAVLAYIRTLKK